VYHPVPGCDLLHVYTPDDIMDGRLPTGRVVIYDDDHYYMGGVLAELLACRGCGVTLCTPAPLVSHWSQFTLEQERIERRLRDLGVAIHTRSALSAVHVGAVTVRDIAASRLTDLACDSVVMVADRAPRDALATDLAPARADGRLRTLRLIGDANAPHIIAQAVFAGHLAAREFDEMPDADVPPFAREFIPLNVQS